MWPCVTSKQLQEAGSVPSPTWQTGVTLAEVTDRAQQRHLRLRTGIDIRVFLSVHWLPHPASFESRVEASSTDVLVVLERMSSRQALQWGKMSRIRDFAQRCCCNVLRKMFTILKLKSIFSSYKLFYYFIMCMFVIHLYVGTGGDQKVLDPLELALQEGGWNGTPVLWRRRKCS